MTIRERIYAIIAKLQAVLPDADKVDAGKTGAPGTRVRKVAQEAKRDLDAMRRDVVAARGAGDED